RRRPRRGERGLRVHASNCVEASAPRSQPARKGRRRIAMSGHAIVAEHLVRKYGDFTAVDDVSFQIDSQEIVGLLGHNGAGKTTIMKMLTGFLEPTAGRALIDGIDVETDRAAAQARLGYLPENCPLYPEMTVIGYLDYVAELRGVEERARREAVR